MVGSAVCTIVTATDVSISRILSDSQAGTFPVEVIVEGKGKASGDRAFEYKFALDSIVPSEGNITMCFG